MTNKRNKILLISIIVIELILMVAVWPGGIIRRDTMYSSGDGHEYVFTVPLYSGDECTQVFVSMGELLKAHSFAVKKVGDLSDDWKLIYELKDSAGNVLIHTQFTGGQVTESGFCTVPADIKLIKGSEYSYTISVEGAEGGVGVTCTPYSEDFTPGETSFYQNGECLGLQSFGQFVYSEKLNIKNVLFTYLFMWIIGGVVFEVFKKTA